MEPDQIQRQVADLTPKLIEELKTLVGIPSVAFPGFDPEPVNRMAEATLDLFRRSGASNAKLLSIPGDYPSVYAEVPGPEDAPTVLLYAHYDVQPAPMEQGWDSDPWQAVTKDDGRIYGRGAADNKSGIVAHAGVLQVFGGKPPVTLKILIEGMEETDGNLEEFVIANPDIARCDIAVICDMGNPEVGQPAVTTALRGAVSFVMTVRSLDHPLHSGVFGGGAPDALTAVTRIVSQFHDDDGNVAIEGLHSFEWPDDSVAVAAFRRDAELLDGVEPVGSGRLASRLWSRPAISVIGMDVPSVAEASNVLLPEASAHVSLRVAPGADADKEFEIVRQFIEDAAPWGVHVEIVPGRSGPSYMGTDSHHARDALRQAYGAEPVTIGSGGSIPLVNTLAAISPHAEIVMWGAEDTAQSRIHASNESVDPGEIERTILAQAYLIASLANR